MKNIDCITVPEAREQVLAHTAAPVQRKQLIDRCIKRQKLTAAELKDKTPGSVLNVINCRFGDAIEQLLTSGAIVQNPDGTLVRSQGKAAPTVKKAQRDAVVEPVIVTLLETSGKTKRDILNAVKEKAAPLLTGVSEQVLLSDAGRILEELIRAEKLELKDGVYSRIHESEEERAARIFNALSDEGLVEHSVNMLKRWYESRGYKVTEWKNTDSPTDGGIDGVITATDELGFQERIILQVKNFHNKNNRVKECEMREFCGVLAKDSATKGLFVTSSKYHQGAAKFAKDFKYKYLALIDGEKWLRLAAACGYLFNE